MLVAVFHAAMRVAATPPAVVKVPPAYSVVPLRGGLLQSLRRLALAPDGEVYALVGPLEGMPIAVRRLQFARDSP